jgi:hypothetical protein
MGKTENARMWKEYTEEKNDSLVLVSSCKSIQTALKFSERRFKFSPVQYVDNEPRPQFDYDSIFFYKDREKYSHEKEFRILSPLMGSDLPFPVESSDSYRRMVSFNFNIGIRRIVFHPNASKSFKKDMRASFRTVFRRLQDIEDSTL